MLKNAVIILVVIVNICFQGNIFSSNNEYSWPPREVRTARIFENRESQSSESGVEMLNIIKQFQNESDTDILYKIVQTLGVVQKSIEIIIENQNVLNTKFDNIDKKIEELQDRAPYLVNQNISGDINSDEENKTEKKDGKKKRNEKRNKNKINKIDLVKYNSGSGASFEKNRKKKHQKSNNSNDDLKKIGKSLSMPEKNYNQ